MCSRPWTQKTSSLSTYSSDPRITRVRQKVFHSIVENVFTHHNYWLLGNSCRLAHNKSLSSKSPSFDKNEPHVGSLLSSKMWIDLLSCQKSES